MTRGEVFQWALPFLWRAIFRMLNLFVGTMVLVPWYTMRQHLKAARATLLLPRPLNFIVDWVRIIVGSVFFVVVALFVMAVGAAARALLPLLSPLLLIPWFKNLAQGFIDGVVESIGDVATWKERPVRATSMRLVVRDALERARDLVGEHGEVHVLAHSQGAAVSTFTILEEIRPASSTSDVLPPSARRSCCSGRRTGRVGTARTPRRYVAEAEQCGPGRAAPGVGEPLGHLGSVLGRAHRRPKRGCPRTLARRLLPRGGDAACRSRGACRPQHEPALPRPFALLRQHACRSSNRPPCTCSATNTPTRPPRSPSSRSAGGDRKEVARSTSSPPWWWPRSCPGLPAVSGARQPRAVVSAVVGSVASAVVGFFPGLDGVSADPRFLAFLSRRRARRRGSPPIGWILASALLARPPGLAQPAHAEADRALARVGALPARRCPGLARPHHGPARASTSSAPPSPPGSRSATVGNRRPDTSWLPDRGRAPRVVSAFVVVEPQVRARAAGRPRRRSAAATGAR